MVSRILFFTCLVLFFIIFGFRAPIVAGDEKEIPKPHEIEIFLIDEGMADTIYNLLWYGRNKKILDLKLPPEAVSKEYLKILQDYVKGGGTVWIYNCDLSAFFGFKSDYLVDGDFKKSKKKIKFGMEDKAPVGVAKSEPVKGSPILEGINKVEVQILELYPGKYSAVKLEEGEDFIPLLKVSGGDKLVAAVKKIGSGYVVFRPVINFQKYDGAMFEINLREFSAHFLLPHEQRQEKTAQFYLRNGQVIQCKVLTKEINFETPEATETIEVLKIKEINLVGGGRFDELILKDGRLLKGFVYTSFIEVEDNGVHKIFNKEYIEKIIFE